MARFGTPIGQSPRVEWRIVVTVEWPDGRVEYKTWKGGSRKRIEAAARSKYKGADLQFGTPIPLYSWGAH